MRGVTSKALGFACLGGAWLLAAAAHADPCEADVSGYAPGAAVSGIVRYVGDGDSLCIGPSANPNSWIEIRIADFYAPELATPAGKRAKDALSRIAKGGMASCIVQRGNNGRTYSYDRLIASCRIGDVGVAAAMKRAGVAEGGRGTR